MKVKICGVTHPHDARLAAELGAWAVGLVFAPQSPRRLAFEQAAVVRAAIPSKVLAVGVFESQTIIEVREVARRLRLNAVQIHGADPKDYEDFEIPVILAYGLRHGDATPRLPERSPFAVLIEPARSAEERNAGRGPSVEAKRRAWVTAAALKGKGPLVVVAGGLTPENAAEAARAAKPDALDVSSGVESAPGIKSPQRLKDFFAAVSA